MDRAINKSTNKLISSFAIHEDGSYQELIKGEWIALQDSVTNWEELKILNIEEVPVHYVKEKEYKNFKGTMVWCDPYFAIYPNSPAKTTEESPEHKKIKNWLFNRLKNDDLEIIYSKATKKYKYDNSNKLSELNIDWNNYSIEVPIRGKKNLQADILIPFKIKHPLLGFGIIIEIQLSKQNEARTFDRTLDRALSGYSTSWLFEDDFQSIEKEIILKSNKLKIFSFSSELKYSGKKFMQDLKLLVEEQCRFLDVKIKETNIYLEKLKTKEEEIYGNILKRLNIREALLFQKIEGLEENPFKGLVENYKKQIQEHISDMEFFLQTSFDKKMKELNYPFCIGECKTCHNGYMTKKRTKTGKEVYGCSNYPTCKASIWVN